MAVIGLGVDLVDVARMEAALAGPRGERLRERVFTATGRAAEQARRLGACRVLVSLAHESTLAIVEAVAESTPE